MANEYIRHLTENGEWEFSNVITVGQLEALNTENKTDLVSAINEMNNHFRLSDDTIDDIVSTIGNINLMLSDIKSDITEGEENLNALRGEINARKTEVDTSISNVRDELEEKIESSSTTIEEIRKKTAELENSFSTNAEKVDGVIVEIKNELLSTNDELSNKLSKTEFNDAVGVNKWVATFYEMESTKYEYTYPKIEDVATLQSSFVDEIADSVELYPFTELKTGLLHLFTNVYLTSAKNIELSVSHTYGMAILMNGAYIYYKAGNGVQKPSMSLRSGWNTIEILLGVDNSIGRIGLDSRISDLVNKMTTVIGVGGKDESRLTHTETMIKQTNEAITFKADNTLVEKLGNDVESHTAELLIQAEQIASKVEQTEFNGYTGKLLEVETNVNQTAEKIESLATKSSIDTLNNIIETHETKISQMNEGIELKASKEELNSVEGTVSTAIGKIEVLEGEVGLKASQTNLDTVTQTVSAHETSIKANADEIALKASKTDVDNLEGRVGIAESSITANTEQIELRASKSELEQATGKIGQLEASLQVAHDEISTKVSSIKYEEDLLNQQNDFDEISEKFSKVETTFNQTNEAINLKASKEEVESLNERVSEAQTSIGLNAEQIELRASKTEVVDAIANIKIGGVNMLSNTTAEWKTEAYHKGGGYGVYRGTSEVTTIYERAFTEDVTVSFEARVDIDGNFQFYGQNNNPKYKPNVVTLMGTQNWKRFSFPLLVEKVEGGAGDCRMEFYGLDTRHVWVRNVKVEIGNKATDYTEKPSDIEGRVMSSLDTSITQTNKAIELKASKIEVQSSIEKAVKDVQVGGRNLLMNTTDELFVKNNYSIWYGTNMPDSQKTGELRFTILGDSGNVGVYSKDKINEPMKVGEKYVLSFYAYLETEEDNLSLDINYLYLMTGDAGNIPFKSTGNIITKNKRKIEVLFEATKNASSYAVMIGTANNTLKGVNIVLSKLKFEKGTKATDWTPSPEDENKYFKKLETAITQTSGELSLKASATDVSGLTERVTVAEQKITPEAIVSTVTNSEGFNTTVTQKIDEWGVTVNDRLGTVESKVTSEAITNTVLDSEGFGSAVNQRIDTWGIGVKDRLSSVELSVKPDSIVSTVTGSEEFSTAVTQKINSWGVDVVRGEDIVSTINASNEGVKIKGEMVDITGMVTFNALDPSTQDIITGAEDLANSAYDTATDASDVATDAYDTATDASSIAISANQTASSAYNLADSTNDTIGNWKHPSDKTSINGGKIYTGSVSAYQLSATAIDGKTITGSTFRTSSSASTNGIIMNSSGMFGYGSGVENFSLSNTGKLTAKEAYISGRISASADSVFGGSISTGKDMTVGNNIYMTYNYDDRFNEKGIIFSDANVSSYETSIKGTYLKMDITANTIRLYPTDGNVQVYGAFATTGKSSFYNGLYVEGTADFSNATVTGLTATFG